MGLGHAVWCARELVGNEPFALLLPDVIVPPEGRVCLKEMIQTQNRDGGNLIAVEEVAPGIVDQYGIVDIDQTDNETTAANNGESWPIRAMVEKPAIDNAPSNLAIMGRYILQPEIFDILSNQAAGKGGEIQITDAMETLMAEQPFRAVKLRGRSFDCGSKLGFLSANLHLGLADESIGAALHKELRELLGST
jgi:UTP--glucose-1-phosphate uridylyltransferase